VHWQLLSLIKWWGNYHKEMNSDNYTISVCNGFKREWFQIYPRTPVL
jgi:hypothetical protein